MTNIVMNVIAFADIIIVNIPRLRAYVRHLCRRIYVRMSSVNNVALGDVVLSRLFINVNVTPEDINNNGEGIHGMLRLVPNALARIRSTRRLNIDAVAGQI